MSEWLLKIYENGELVGGIEVVDDQAVLRGDPAALVRVAREVRGAYPEHWRPVTHVCDRAMCWQHYEWPEEIEPR